MFFSSLPDHLNACVIRGEKYVVCTNRNAWLATSDDVLAPAGSARQVTVFHVLEIEHFWQLFEQVRGDRCYFDESEVQKITRLTVAALNRLKKVAFIEPLGGQYDPQQVFALVLASVLLRRQCSFKVAAKVANFALRGEGVTCQKV